MGLSSIPDWFDTATNYLYGTPSGGTDTLALWEQFLQSESAAPYVTVDPATKKNVLLPGKETDPAVQSLYLSFLRAELSKVYQAERTTLLSPVEVEQRKVVFTIFDILQTMLKSAMTTQMAVGEEMSFFTQKQKTYSDLMSRVPFYEGRGSLSKGVSYGSERPSSADWSSTAVSYSDDPTQYNLGYANIKLSEIADWCAAEVDNTADSFNPQPGVVPMFTTTTTNFTTPYYKANGDIAGHTNVCYTMKIYLTRLADGTVQVQTSLDHTSNDSHFADRNLPYPMKETFSSTVISASSDITDITKAVEDAYYGTYYQAAVRGMPFDDHPLMIPYQPGILAGSLADHTSDQKMQNFLQKYSSKRSALNQSLGTYVESLRSKMDLYGDKRDQAKQLVDSSIQMRKMTTSIITSCIQQMSNILSSIFR